MQRLEAISVEDYFFHSPFRTSFVGDACWVSGFRRMKLCLEKVNILPHVKTIDQPMMRVDRHRHDKPSVFLHHFAKRYLGGTVRKSKTPRMG